MSKQLRGKRRESIAANVLDLYRAGHSIRQITDQLKHWSYGTIRALLLEAGEPLRPRGGANRRRGAL